MLYSPVRPFSAIRLAGVMMMGTLLITLAGTLPARLSAEVPASTREMAAKLQEVWRDDKSKASPFRGKETAQEFRELLNSSTDIAQKTKNMELYAFALLRAGENEASIAAYEAYEKFLRETNQAVTNENTTLILTSKAMGYLRIGELENCLLNHNADSCLLPIRGGGVHQIPRGSRAALDLLAQQLTRMPNDLRARWLYNIASMTLGEYPDKVPKDWLLKPELFASDYDIKRFPDVAGALGVDVDDLAGGVVLDDFDRDGFLDIMASAWGPESQMRFFHNNGDGTFADRTVEAGLMGEKGGLNMIHGDYNNDGLVDVLVLRGGWLGAIGRYPDSLLRNNGDNTFTDVTVAAGLLSFHPNQTAVWLDYNGDGWLDIFVGNESEGTEVHPCQLYRNNGDGTFTDCAAESGVAVVGFVKGVVSADYNNDGRPDIYISRRDGANLLLRNDGPAGTDKSPRATWRFTDVAEQAGVVEPYRSFSCWFWDYDNDGWPDLMVNGYYLQDSGDVAADYLGLPSGAEVSRLYHNNGDGTFEEVGKKMGVRKLLHAMGCNFGDLDNDGWLDCYIGTGDPEFTTLIPNRMFRNDGGRRFQDVTTSGGFGQLQKGHAIAFGDIDNDGDQDIYSVVGGALSADNYHNQLFANPGHGNHWLKLQLEGVQTNRVAIGARIKLVVKDASGERIIQRTVGSGGSFGAAPFRQEIGVGQATTILRAEIFWPVTGRTQVVTGLEINRSYRIREGEAKATPVELRTFQLPTAPAEHQHHHHHAMQDAPSADQVATDLAQPSKQS